MAGELEKENQEHIELQELFAREYEKINEENAIALSEPTILAKINLSLTAQRILRVVASMIKENDPANKIYRFEIKDFCKVFGLSNAKIHKNLRSAIEELRQTFTLPVGKGRITGFISTGQLFENEVQVQFDPFLQPYYQKSINGEYKLINIKGFNYSYTFRFYELFLLKLKDKEEVTFYIDLGGLKEWLKITDKYNSYADLKRRIINPIVNDINGNRANNFEGTNFCNLRIEYDEVKNGKKIVGLNIHVTRVKIAIEGPSINELVNGNEIFDNINPSAQQAYTYLKNILRVHQNTIDKAIRDYGEEVFYKIYLYIRRSEMNQQIKNITRYAASCLQKCYYDDTLTDDIITIGKKAEEEKDSIKQRADEIRKQFEPPAEDVVKEKAVDFFEMYKHIYEIYLNDEIKYEVFNKTLEYAKNNHALKYYLLKDLTLEKILEKDMTKTAFIVLTDEMLKSTEEK